MYPLILWVYILSKINDDVSFTSLIDLLATFVFVSVTCRLYWERIL